MITFFLSSMSLVWTYTVMVPFLRGNTYQRENCILKGVSGVPTECQNHTYFQNMNLNRGESCEGQCNAVGIKAADDEDSSVEQYDCFKFHVERDFSVKNSSSNPSPLPSQTKRFVLHIDEIDMVGLCSQQVHCSVQKPLYTNFEANCKTQVDCERMVNHCKKMYPVKQLTIGYQSRCWIDDSRDENQGAIAVRQMESFSGSRAFHSVIWPLSAFIFSVFSCCTFWYKNRNHVLKFTQSG